MSQKIKPRQQRKPRSLIVKDMIINNHGGPMRDRRERRSNETKYSWKKEAD